MQGIRTRKADGYTVMEKADGGEYWELFTRFRLGEVAAKRIANACVARDIHLLEDGGRKYILKWDHTGWGFGGEGETERFLWKALRGPFYSRLMRRVLRARDSGCDRCQDMLLAAEKRTLWYCHDAVVLFEYLEGKSLEKLGDLQPLLPEIAACMLSLHAHGLALCDTNPRNFIKGADGVKAIDLVCRGNFRLDRIKDVVRMRKNYGIDLPLRDTLDRLLCAGMNAYLTARTWYAERRARRRELRRRKYFRSQKDYNDGSERR